MKPDDAFIEEYRPFVLSLAHKVRAQLGLTGDLDDLLSAGFEGLLEAQSRYDASRGVKFNTFAYYRVRGAIIDAVRRQGFHSRRAWSRLRAAEATDLVTEHSGDARAADPSSRGDVAKTVRAIDDSLTRITAGFVMAAVGQPEDVPEPTPEENLLSGETAARLRDAVTRLPERERLLVEGYYFGARRFDHVARELGISKSWASRLHTKALDKLRAELEAA